MGSVMKKLIVLVLVLVATVAVASPTTQPAATTQAATQPGDPRVHAGLVSIIAPEGWTRGPNAFGTEIVVGDLSKGPKDFVTNVNVMKVSAEGATVEKAVKAAKRDIARFIENVRWVDGGTVVKTASGEPATRLVYWGRVFMSDTYFIQYVVSGGKDTVYVVTGACPVAEASDRRPILEASLASIEVRK
jgi:hypothetical protein